MNKIKYISVFSIAMLLLVAAVEFVVSLFWEGGISQLFWVAPLYFWMFYVVTISIFKKSGNPMHYFMAFKGVKMFTTMVVAFALAFVMRSSAKELMIYFLLYYMVLLVAECGVLLYMRKKNIQ